MNFPKSYPESKIVTCSFIDSHTGEVLFSSCKSVRIRCDQSLENYTNKLFQSYLRGLRQKNLAFLIDVVDLPQEGQLEFNGQPVY